MDTSQMRDFQERKDQHQRVLIQWPWLLVAAAWAVLVFATLAHQTFLLDHHYLLQTSGLPWLAALEIFLLCWQVMTVAMMLPASMPMVKLVADAGRRQERPVAVPMAFLAGYGMIWTAFAAGAFLGDTLVHRLVDLASQSSLDDRSDYVHRSRSLSVEPLEGAEPEEVPHAT